MRERERVEQQHVVRGGESDERAAEGRAGHVRERLRAQDGAVGGVQIVVVDEHRHDGRVETILKIPVVTPQTSASATIVPARPGRHHQRPGGGRQQLAGSQAGARRHAVEQVPEHRSEDHRRAGTPRPRSPRRRPGRRSGRGSASCSATTPAQVPRFVIASASQNEKKRQPGGPITARRTGESAPTIADPSYASQRNRRLLVDRPGRAATATGPVTAPTYWLAMSVILDGEQLTLGRGRARRPRRRARRGGVRRARSRPGRARRGRAGSGGAPTASTASRPASACASGCASRATRWTPTTAVCCAITAWRPGPTHRARSCAPPWCGSRTASRRAPRACGPSCWRASSTHSTPARRRACACSAPRARAISARSPTSPSASAATCPWPPRRASR